MVRFLFRLEFHKILKKKIRKFPSSFKVLTNKFLKFPSYSISIIEWLFDSLSFRLSIKTFFDRIEKFFDSSASMKSE